MSITNQNQELPFKLRAWALPSKTKNDHQHYQALPSKTKNKHEHYQTKTFIYNINKHYQSLPYETKNKYDNKQALPIITKQNQKRAWQ